MTDPIRPMPDVSRRPDHHQLMIGKFVIVKNKVGEYLFMFKAANGEVLMGSEGYVQKSSALNGIEAVRRLVPTSSIDDSASDV